MGPDVCPSCGESTVVPGRLVCGEQGVASRFVPDGSRMFPSKSGVRLRSDEFRACLSCGHLWASLPSDKLRSLIEDYGKALRSFVEEHGSELARQHLATLDWGPHRDLPDVSEAREAGRAIAAIDDLMLGEQVSQATRLYREVTGSTWDQAIAAMRRWRDLTRAEKLEVFGWAPKEKVPVDDWADPYA